MAEDEGPFCYVPGSHLLTPERLEWEREMSISAASNRDSYSARGSFRASPEDLQRMKLGKPAAFAVPANTLVVGDTVGFHARGLLGTSLAPGGDLGLWPAQSVPPLDGARSPEPARHCRGARAAAVEGLDRLQSLGLARNSWVDKGLKRPLDD